MFLQNSCTIFGAAFPPPGDRRPNALAAPLLYGRVVVASGISIDDGLERLSKSVGTAKPVHALYAHAGNTAHTLTDTEAKVASCEKEKKNGSPKLTATFGYLSRQSFDRFVQLDEGKIADLVADGCLLAVQQGSLERRHDQLPGYLLLVQLRQSAQQIRMHRLRIDRWTVAIVKALGGGLAAVGLRGIGAAR